MSAPISAPKQPPSKAKVQQALSCGLARAVSTAGGAGTLADSIGTSADTIKRALAGDGLPGLHVAFAALLTDLTALDEVARLHNVKIVPRSSDAANDMDLVAGLADSAGEFARRLADGKRCHVDTAILAELFRRLIPQMQTIVCEHDARRAA